MNTKDKNIPDVITVFLKGDLLEKHRSYSYTYSGDVHNGMQVIEGVLYIIPAADACAGYKVFAPGEWAHVDVTAKSNPNYIPPTNSKDN